MTASPVFHHATTPLGTRTTVIAASAGTGKTFTLAALVVRLVAELGVPIQRLLLTTYTVAATAELRDRIRRRLIQTLEAVHRGSPGDDPFLAELLPLLPVEARVRLEEAIRDFDEANISTIHGFCQSALRELAFEAGESFQTELTADAESVFRDVAEDYWRKFIYAAPPLVAAIVAAEKLLPSHLLPPLRALNGREKVRIIPAADELAALQSDLLATLEEFRAQWPAWRDELQQLLVAGNQWGNKHYKAADLQVHLDQLECASRGEATCVELLSACKTFCHLTSEELAAGTHKRKQGQPISHAFIALCDRFSTTRERFRGALLSHFFAWSREELRRVKEERGILLFDDLLMRLHAALNGAGGTAVITRLRARFEAVLVDEFQDTDPVQAEIFLRVFNTEQHRLFLIGDPKQAIYAFRGADLYAYLGAVAQAEREYTLQENQRSAQAMVEAVNVLFQRVPEPFLDHRIRFEPVAAAGRADKEPLLSEGRARPPFHFWHWDSDERIAANRARDELPAMMAAEMTRFLRSGATIGGRAVVPGDCAVLCGNNREAREIAAALSVQGIPSVVLSNANVFHSEQAAEMRTMLAALAEPGREGLLRAALATLSLGSDMGELLRMKEEAPRWEIIRQRWLGHHQRWLELGFIRMFREFLRTEQIRPRLLAMRNGDRHLTNLEHLAELLHQASEQRHLGPLALITWLDEQMRPQPPTEETEVRLDRDDSAVRVITIHKSKGLEFPVVFCPFLWGNIALRKEGPWSFHEADGTLVYDMSAEPNPEHRTRAEDEELAERARLLYVALTRAKYECHVVWGPFGHGNTRGRQPELSALFRLLEPASEILSLQQLAAHAATIPPARLRTTLEELRHRFPDYFETHALFAAPAAPFQPEERENPVRGPKAFAGKIDRTWRSISYTALTRLHDHADAPETEVPTDAPPALIEGIHAFPRGLRAGICLHHVLEHVDFTAESFTEFLTERLRHHGMSTPENVAAVEKMLGAIKAVLPPEALARNSSLRELEFHLPARLLTPSDLAELAGGPLVFDPQQGVLRGVMDVVFEKAGRYHVLDWKSNWLGRTSEAYTPEAMEAEMQRYRYSLQRQIYLFALHRFLALRIPGYSPEVHLGGTLYVFVRGIDPSRPQLGLHTAPPDMDGLRKLGTLFTSA